jgi:hypothetical protein
MRMGTGPRMRNDGDLLMLDSVSNRFAKGHCCQKKNIMLLDIPRRSRPPYWDIDARRQLGCSFRLQGCILLLSKAMSEEQE